MVLGTNDLELESHLFFDGYTKLYLPKTINSWSWLSAIMNNDLELERHHFATVTQNSLSKKLAAIDWVLSGTTTWNYRTVERHNLRDGYTELPATTKLVGIDGLPSGIIYLRIRSPSFSRRLHRTARCHKASWTWFECHPSCGGETETASTFRA